MNTYPFTLPPLRFPQDALLPYIDAETVFLHHEKHFGGYVEKLNAAIEPIPRLHGLTVEELLMRPAMLPAQSRTAILRNAGGVYNHTLYFDMLTPPDGETCDKTAAENNVMQAAILHTFGSFEALKTQLSAAANSVFGSGWAILASHPRTGLHIVSLANQDTLVREGLRVHLIFDVWEHAYYLKYKNERARYVGALWEVSRFLL